MSKTAARFWLLAAILVVVNVAGLLWIRHEMAKIRHSSRRFRHVAIKPFSSQWLLFASLSLYKILRVLYRPTGSALKQ